MKKVGDLKTGTYTLAELEKEWKCTDGAVLVFHSTTAEFVYFRHDQGWISPTGARLSPTLEPQYHSNVVLFKSIAEFRTWWN